jgi:hypothetical protein
MNPRELVDHIRSGPAELTLDGPLRFRRRTRSSPCDFHEFLQALQSSETIRDVACFSHLALCITEDDWVLLIKTMGRIRGIQCFRFDLETGSRYFHPFQAVADAMSSAHSLRKMVITISGISSPTRDPSGQTALAYALREHAALQVFAWIDWYYNEEAAQGVALDTLLRALQESACPNARTIFITTACASASATKKLLQLGPATDLHLVVNTELWLAVADGIRQGRCNVKKLYLGKLYSSESKNTEGVKAIASAIRLDRKLEHLTLVTMNDFTDEADEAGVALAEALTVNNTLRTLNLCQATLGAQAYIAFSAMLRVHTNLVLKLTPLDDTIGDQRLVDSRNQMVIEQQLNNVGRGRLLSSSQTPRKEWVDALNDLNSDSCVNEIPKFHVSCLFSLLRLNPSVCLLELSDTTTPRL